MRHPVTSFFIGIGIGLVALTGLASCTKDDMKDLSPATTRNPQEGAQIKRIHNKTLADVKGDLRQISTYQYAIPEMHTYTVDAALQTGKPLILALATPAHCTQCDDQLKLIKGFLEAYPGQINVIHIDQYGDPNSYKELNVIGDPWTFVIDATGVVRRRFPGKALFEEMNPVVEQVITESKQNQASQPVPQPAPTTPPANEAPSHLIGQ